ncbi:hypothetical protein FHL15_002223 [Xylaria flabelliformis]|uniref:Uncharacterized protein n=1 Tax=Xylaria flabelliformis TaxID=2512241 RepID=A0A553I9Q8_9PEZI|nr:hypothetical protein FHL15_002223 [Xylaria flabelliformis]
MAFVNNVVLYCLSFVTLSTPILALKSRPCYRIDGSLNDYSYNGFGEFYLCNPDQEVSHCCFGRDICIDNGLCMGFGSSRGADRIFMLAGCTDAGWPAPCPQYFVSDRHEILNGSRRLLIWPCAPYDSGESCVGSDDSDFTAACCADPSLRIKTIPLQKSMHLAMDPTQKIEMFADDDGDVSSSPDDGSANGGPSSNNASDTVLEVLAVLVAVVFGVCQWQFPKTRIRLGWIAHRRANRQQAHARYVEDIIDLAEIPASFRDEGDALDLETQRIIPESYSDRIGHLLEIEDATPTSWRTASWLDV